MNIFCMWSKSCGSCHFLNSIYLTKRQNLKLQGYYDQEGYRIEQLIK